MWTTLENTWVGKRGAISLLLIAVAAVVLTLFDGFEMGGETWGYWMFARIFGDTGEFIATDRSPLYTLYLNAFRWLGYPTAVTAEYLLTISVVLAGMVVLFRRFLGLMLAVFAALLWLPFLQSAEPPVQALAMGFSCFGISARWSSNNRTKFAGSYALFGVAYLFRSSYLVFVLLFLAWDIFQFLRHNGTSRLTGTVKSLPRKAWPVLIPVVLLVWFLVAQSASPWNNVNFETMTWFPNGSPKSLANSQFIQAYNQQYIVQEYGTLEGRDFYYTNEELFDGEGSILGAVRENWQFIVQQSGRNLKSSLSATADFSEIRKIYSRLDPPLPREFWFALIVIGIWFGAARASREPDVLLFVTGSTVVVLATMWFLPNSSRHYVAIVPIMVLSASWYGRRLAQALSPEARASRALYRAGLAGAGVLFLYLVVRTVFAPLGTSGILIALAGTGAFLVLAFVDRFRTADWAWWCRDTFRPAVVVGTSALALVLLTTGVNSWADIARDSASNLKNKDALVLQRPTLDSIKAANDTLEPLLSNCQGVLSFEHKFLGAFSDVPVSNIYDIFEIPPFGDLGDSEYDGLRPDRIDCVFVSDALATSLGGGFNVRMRFQDYIEPYVQQLEDMGAVTHDLGEFGRLTVLAR